MNIKVLYTISGMSGTTWAYNIYVEEGNSCFDKIIVSIHDCDLPWGMWG